MTREEAIQHCEEAAAGEIEQGECPKCAAEHKQLAAWLRELVALRAQQVPAKLDRNRWKGCDNCTAGDGEFRYLLGEWGDGDFCSRCGRPLTEEAWAELERRMTGSYAAAELHHES